MDGAGGAPAAGVAPKNMSGISSVTEVFFGPAAPFFWRAKNSGARTLSGNSSSVLSWTETATAADLIQERRSRHAKTTRPRLSAGSIRFAGRVTCAFSKSNWLISSFNASGQFSKSTASDTSSGGSAETCGGLPALGASAGCGTSNPAGRAECGALEPLGSRAGPLFDPLLPPFPLLPLGGGGRGPARRKSRRRNNRRRLNGLGIWRGQT